MKRLLLAFILLSFLYCQELSAQKKARYRIQKTDQLKGLEYKPLTFDGAWCWFSDLRAIHRNKKTYFGYVNSFGNIEIGVYDHKSGKIVTKILHSFLQKDDHANPSLLFLPDGRLMVFYTKHSNCCGAQPPYEMFYRISDKPEDISEWSQEMTTGQNTRGFAAYCYSNPVRLTDESNKIYLFWRGGNFRPNFSTSDDLGKTWTSAKTLINHKKKENNVRPYVKIASNGKDKIHIAFTDGHPRVENQNSIYYMAYKKGNLLKANGDKIASLNEIPVAPRDAHVVYDGRETGQKAWIWDVAEDKNGHPVLVYAVFPDDDNHLYYYSRWDGKKWKTHELVNSGKWFPETQEGQTEKEPNYSGGIILDHENPSVVYLSRKKNGVFEIEKWQTGNNGKSWKVYPVTSGSENDNVRPFAIRGAETGNPLQLLWMNNHKYIHFTDYHASVRGNLPYSMVTKEINRQSVLDNMYRVADWQLANPHRHHELNWHYGAFYTGLMAHYETTKEQRYLNEMINVGKSYDWKIIDDIFHADRLTIGQVFMDIYEKEKTDSILTFLQYALDIHIAHLGRKEPDLEWKDNKYRHFWWSWCDALYMAPATFAKMSGATEKAKYLDFANTFWWETSEFLYDDEEHLYYRDSRFFDKRSQNGNKVFWSRGNGWVVGGLVHMLETIPDNYPDRQKYVTQYKEMTQKLAEIQGKDGLWGASLLDREQYPIGESSGSAFFCYAITWGINQGILDKETYKPVVLKAWEGLVNNLQKSGMLGYVQQVGDRPKDIKADDWEVYGSGAFLLAGSEIYKLIDE